MNMFKTIQRALRGRTILSRLLLSFILLSLIPLSFVLLVVLNLSQNALRAEVENNLNTTADSKAAQIETYALERSNDITELANVLSENLQGDTLLRARASVNGNEQLFTIQYALYSPRLQGIADRGGYRNFLMFSEDGILLFESTTEDRIGQSFITDASDPTLALTLQNAKTLLVTEISDFVLQPQTNEPVAYVAAPLINNGVVLAIIAIELDNEDLYGVVNERVGLGETGETIVAFAQGDETLFGAPTFHNPALALAGYPSGSGRGPIDDAINGVQGEGIFTDYRGEEVIGVWRYLPSLRWGMIVKQDTDEAFAPINNQQDFVIGLGTVSLLSIVAAAIVLASSLSRPIRNLVDATRTVAGGVYENKIEAAGPTEVQELIDAIDEMVSYTIATRTEELQRVAEQERESSRLKDEFIAVMSHELRTPLNAIIGFLGIVQKKANLDEKNNHRLTRARANSERLLGLINDILDVSRVESGRVQVFAKSIQVHTFFNRIYAQTSVLAEEKQLAYDLIIDDAMPPTITTDEDLLTKIIINLVGNACKFTEEGSVQVMVKPVDKMFSIAVKDTGPGVPFHMQEVIFERFRQVDSSSTRQHGGSGLGLSIVSSLTTTLGGTVALNSVPGEGSTFTVTLPMVADQQHTTTTPEIEPEVAPA